MPTKTPVRSLTAAPAEGSRASRWATNPDPSRARPAAYNPRRSVRWSSLRSLRSSTRALGSNPAISPARDVGQPEVSHCRMGRIADRPVHTASQISSGDMPRGADGTAPAHDHPGAHALTSSGFLRTRQLLEPPKPKELEMATRIRRTREWSRTNSRSHSGSGVARFAFTGRAP